MDTTESTTDPLLQEKICSQCHVPKLLSEFYRRKDRPCGYAAACKVCAIAQHKPYMAQWHLDNPGYMATWEAAHQEHRQAYAHVYYARPEIKASRRVYMRQWRLDNAEHVQTYDQAYHIAHPEVARKSAKKRYHENPQVKEAVIAHGAIRRARQLHASQVERISRRYLYTRDKGVCQLCFRKVSLRLKHPHPLSPSIDHVIPLSQGGNHTHQNTVLTHLRCNLKKRTNGSGQQLRLLG